MFGLTKREQQWKAEQQAAGWGGPAAMALRGEAIRQCIAEAQADAAERARLCRENAELRRLLTRYRDETPLGNQPHMIAQHVDNALGLTQKFTGCRRQSGAATGFTSTQQILTNN